MNSSTTPKRVWGIFYNALGVSLGGEIKIAHFPILEFWGFLGITPMGLTVKTYICNNFPLK